MFDRIKFLASALIGLLIGILVTLPLFWLGVRKNVGALRHKAEVSFAQVERRQQTMADESLRLEKRLAGLNWRQRKADFVKVELLRSRLAGFSDIEEKIEISQDLERALLETEKILGQARRQSQTVAKNPFVHDFELTWDTLKRYLVDEQLNFVGDVRGYNHVLKVWPVPTIVGYRNFSSLVKATWVDLRDEKTVMLRQSKVWAGWAIKWAYAKARGRILPAHPAGFSRSDKKEMDLEPLYELLPEPLYVAKAARPEEDYSEIQYDRSYPDMADTEEGEEKAVFDNKYAQPYNVAPVPTLQKTVSYK